MGKDRRWFAPLTLVLGVGLAASACSADATGPQPGERLRGIVAWEDPPGPPTMASVGVDREDAEGDGGIPGPLTARIEAPDAVDAGAPFTARIVTLGPSLCWTEDGADVSDEGNRIDVVAWDRAPAPGVPCALALGELSRNVQLTFPEPGEGTIRLLGRRVVGEDYLGEEDHDIQVTVVVR